MQKNLIEKDFYKLMNNSNFGHDCRNNLDNSQFVPIFDELQEITYLKKYHSYFDSKVSSFVSSDLIKQEIEEKYNDSLMKLPKGYKFYNVKFSTLKAEKNECLETAENFDKKTKRQKTLHHYLNRQEEAYRGSKIKRLIDFNEEYVSSIKSLATEKETKINLTTRFLNGKMLMFCKTSIQSFIYDLIHFFMFPDEDIKIIYDKYKIIKCFIYQNLRDTDSTSMFFVFICEVAW